MKIAIACPMVFGLLAFKGQAYKMEKGYYLEESSGFHEDQKNGKGNWTLDASYIFLIIISALITYSFLLMWCWQSRKSCCRDKSRNPDLL